MPWFFSLLADSPVLRTVQIAIIAGAVIAMYLVFAVTREIMLRTKSFWYQLGCILLSAILPIVGYFLYLLIRPASSLREKSIESMLKKILAEQKKQAS